MRFGYVAAAAVLLAVGAPVGTQAQTKLKFAHVYETSEPYHTEAVWAAGPLTKGANLCHGTAGNGHAFLALHRRTRDPMWLERARAFAMHAIAQAEADARRFGQLRHSLWTGDVGLALYLWDCIHGQAEFPTLDVFFAPPEFA